MRSGLLSSQVDICLSLQLASQILLSPAFSSARVSLLKRELNHITFWLKTLQTPFYSAKEAEVHTVALKGPAPSVLP